MRAIVFVLVLALFGMAYADVGPSPAAPSITLRVLENGEPYTGYVEVTYICSEELPPDVEPDDDLFGIYMPLECEDGVCTNYDWYYKLNDCFYSSGVFEMKNGGETKSSIEVDLTSPGDYEFSFDVETDVFLTLKHEPKQQINICCGSFLMLVLLPLAAFVRSQV